MNKFRTPFVIAGSAVLLLAGATAAMATWSWTRHDDVTVVTPSATEPTVEVLGGVTGLLPGKTAPLRVAIENPNDFPVRITKIGGGNTATGSGCPAWAVRVTPSTDSAYAMTIPARARRTTTIQIAMQDWADQKCAGQRFALDLTTFMTAA
jgi:hypothetical protein